MFEFQTMICELTAWGWRSQTPRCTTVRLTGAAEAIMMAVRVDLGRDGAVIARTVCILSIA